jgi:osmoprotectant transport system ATP-binding protein
MRRGCPLPAAEPPAGSGIVLSPEPDHGTTAGAAPGAPARAAPGSPALSARGVVKRYDGTTALDGVSLEVAGGSCVALVGESGSGKTTLLRCFNRLVDPDAGEVRVDGKDVRGEDPVRLRRRVGYVPQDGGLLPHWRVLRNVELVPRLLALEDARARAEAALELVGLDPARFAARWPRELSGGQRQRVAIARALAARPSVVLLDEPLGALDAITRGELQEAFDALRRELGVTALLVTHDLREAARLADRIAVLHEGKVEQAADARELRAAPATPYVRRLVETSGLAGADA